MRHRSILMLTLLVAAICALLLLPIPVPPALARWHALADELENLGHPAVFAALGIAILSSFRPQFAGISARRVFTALVAGLVLGSATEYVQTLVGRDGAWNDVAGDMLGCVCGIAWQLARESRGDFRRQRSRMTLLAVSAAAAMLAAAPLLWTTIAYTARARETPLFWRADSRPMQRFAHEQLGRYPGLVIQEPPADWRGYGTLVVEVANLRSTPVEINVRVHDRWHDKQYSDRYNMHQLVGPGSPTQIRISLERVRNAPRTREMDMSWIRGVGVFVTAPESMADVQVRRLYLER
jgi:VanZ family protein